MENLGLFCEDPISASLKKKEFSKIKKQAREKHMTLMHLFA